MSGGMFGFIHSLIRTLRIPTNAGSNDPRAVWGPDVPAVLQTYYETALTGIPNSVVFAELWYASGTIYRYRGLILFSANTAYVVQGYVVNNVTVLDTQITFYDNFNNYSGDLYSYLRSRHIVVVGNSLPGAAIDAFSQFAINPSHNFLIDGVSQPRGLITRGVSGGASGAIGAETVIHTLPSATYKNDRAYKITIRIPTTGSVGQTVTWRIRKGTNTAGALWVSGTRQYGAAYTDVLFDVLEIRNISGADITTQIVLTLQASAGTVTASGSGNSIRYVEVADCGNQGDYGSAFAIT